MTAPASLTHQHLFAVINTLLQRANESKGPLSSRTRLKILDIGCGDGVLIAYLQKMLEAHNPKMEIDIYGFDIEDHGFADSSQRPNTLRLLKREHPHVDWSERIVLQSAEENWRFPENYFDFAISNQVLEHVDDLDHFLDNVKRVLRPNGQSIHLFPLGSCLMETHTNMPLVHHIRDHETRVAYAGLMNKLGFSRYKKDRDILGYRDQASHAVDSADYLQGFTCYRSFNDFYTRCNKLGLTLTSCYTKDLYLAKLRQVMKLPPQYQYSQWNFMLGESIASSMLKYLSSMTLTMKKVDYDIGERIRREKAYRNGDLINEGPMVPYSQRSKDEEQAVPLLPGVVVEEVVSPGVPTSVS